MGPSDAWPLFGQPARLPTAPFALAARSDAPVFLLVPWRKGLHHFGGAVELITPERLAPEASVASAARGRDREAAIAQMRERLYPVLERYISEHPEQWVSALSPVWETTDAQPQSTPAAPIEAATAHAVASGVGSAMHEDITSAASSGGARVQP